MSVEQTAFFTLHRDLPREGPGEAADVAWAAEVAGLSSTANMADVACGPGADIGALLDAAPNGQVTALDKTAHFVSAARGQWGADPRVTILKADMARIANTYDFIWCAGAVYFMGVTEALSAWRKALKPGGAIAFSQICWFTDAPADSAKTFWAREYPAMTDAAGIAAQINAAGYETLATRTLSDAAWEAYYTPLDARAATLQTGADAPLQAVLKEAEEETTLWRSHRRDFGYLLSVVRPK
jgi:trans-aconitate methyltransferase